MFGMEQIFFNTFLICDNSIIWHQNWSVLIFRVVGFEKLLRVGEPKMYGIIKNSQAHWIFSAMPQLFAPHAAFIYGFAFEFITCSHYNHSAYILVLHIIYELHANIANTRIFFLIFDGNIAHSKSLIFDFHIFVRNELNRYLHLKAYSKNI